MQSHDPNDPVSVVNCHTAIVATIRSWGTEELPTVELLVG
ncbi:hypothetical protein SAMCFNEI73_pC1688 (plasmid) [Sinorhizobium americanum]|uniref:Uncharacterized protein n=1 Tax=Sinorhizobium americanum TaxID=194963 RepID=A0A1L3LZ72_9HYPH|nr:hypothetical protein SAMCFNEI73_pC1688 [Sinorhizobium americanum]